MADPYELRVFERNQTIFDGQLVGPAELGRQRDADEEIRRRYVRDGVTRIVVARADENTIGREQARIEPLGGGRFRITNLSKRSPLRISSNPQVDLDRYPDSRELTAPILLMLGQSQKQVSIRELTIEPPDLAAEDLRTLSEATRRPGTFGSHHDSLVGQPLPEISRMEIRQLVHWLQGTLTFLQSAAQPAVFFDKMAQDVIDFVGLDAGVLLEVEQDAWVVRASKSAPQVRLDKDWSPSHQVLRKVMAEKRTFYQAPGDSLSGLSLAGIRWVVAAPILSRNNEVIGALYGDRRPGTAHRPQSNMPISEDEALLIEYLASVVAAGLDRVAQEKKVLEAQVTFAQFFTSELASHLAEHPDLLVGRDSEVTILFCDIREFSRYSEQLGPARTVEWINDVMGTLSDCVLNYEGVLVDYIGDELMAMWGAPNDQPQQAALACKAALAMIETLGELNARWEPIIGQKMDFGIGINTGIARVGNTGSRQKFKYGPLGNTVNLASRVQGATKYLKARLLITGATHSRLDDGFRTRRLCKVSVRNISEPVDLFEVIPPGECQTPEIAGLYEQALDHFESGRFHDAARLVSQLVGEFRNDGPLLLLMSRTADCLRQEPGEAFNAVWQLPGK